MTSFVERSDSIDTIDNELDWLIQKDEEEALNAGKQARENGHDQNTERKEYERKTFDTAYPHMPKRPESADGRELPEFRLHQPNMNGDPGLVNDLDLTEDQRQAMMELGSMKLDLGLPEDDPPEYDVADRVRQLNEELAKEPTPNSDARRTSIKFKETLVDLVAPPYDYSDDDEEESRENGDTRNSQGGRVGGGADTQKDDGGEKVLVEHGGKFELISSSDLTAEEKRMYGVEDSSDVANSVGGRKSAPTTAMKPRPPDVQRPSTANGMSSRQHFHVTTPKRRPKSAQPSGSSDEVFYNFDYVSPYGLSPEQKKCLQRQKQLQERNESEQTRADQEKNESKQRENELAFQAWLSQKRDEHHRQPHDPTKGSPSSENGEPKSSQSFDEWLKSKRHQRRQSLQMEKQRKKEFTEGWYVRSREDCQRAFRQWLKRKNADLAKTKVEERQSMRMHRLLNRRSHKSQALLRSVTQAQSFRYVDYYGYRF